MAPRTRISIRRFEHTFTRLEPFVGEVVKKAAIRAAA